MQRKINSLKRNALVTTGTRTVIKPSKPKMLKTVIRTKKATQLLSRICRLQKKSVRRMAIHGKCSHLRPRVGVSTTLYQGGLLPSLPLNKPYKKRRKSRMLMTQVRSMVILESEIKCLSEAFNPLVCLV